MNQNKLILDGLDVTNFKEPGTDFSYEFSMRTPIIEYPLTIRVYQDSEADLRLKDIMNNRDNYYIEINIKPKVCR